jgi:uncharacterized membrane protein YfcA
VQIDWSFLEAVNWAEVAWLSTITLLAALIGKLIFRHWFWAAILAGVLFAVAYVFLAYYFNERPVPAQDRRPRRDFASTEECYGPHSESVRPGVTRLNSSTSLSFPAFG